MYSTALPTRFGMEVNNMNPDKTVTLSDLGPYFLFKLFIILFTEEIKKIIKFKQTITK